MVLDITPEKILSERDFSRLWEQLIGCATELALLGEVNLSRDLVGPLFRNTAMSTAGCAIIYSGLNFAWKETQNWPQDLPAEERSDGRFEQTRKRFELNRKEVQKDMAVGRDSLEACLAVEDVWGADDKIGWHAQKKSARLVHALDISLRLHWGQAKPSKDGSMQPAAQGDVTDLDATAVDVLNRIVHRWHADHQVAYLADAEELWPCYIHGLIANAVGISHEELREKGQAILDAFSQRLQEGRKPSKFDQVGLKSLLQMLNDNTTSGSGKIYFEEADFDVPENLFRGPANEDEIAKLEDRLDIRLPEDYKEFLGISNGFGTFTGMEDGIFNGYGPDPELYPVDKVNWNSEPYFQIPVQLIELPREIELLADTSTKTDTDGCLDWDTPLPLFDRVLEIGTRDIDNLWLVHPGLVAQAKVAYGQMYERANDSQRRLIDRAMESFAGSRAAFEKLEWCCVKWMSGGAACMSGHAGFRQYIQDLAEDTL
jgi:hypothetical protein